MSERSLAWVFLGFGMLALGHPLSGDLSVDAFFRPAADFTIAGLLWEIARLKAAGPEPVVWPAGVERQ